MNVNIVRRSPVFYGWVVMVVAALGMIASSPGQSYSISLFIDSFISDFNIDRTTISGLYGLGTFGAALTMTWVGRQIDRYGNRRLAVIISLLFILVLIAMSFVNGPWTLLVGFFLIRGLGQGALFLVNSTVIANWFFVRRGRVMSIALLAFSLSQMVYVPALQRMLEVYSWRQIWVVLAVFAGLLTIPLAFLLLRDHPEDFGLSPDGDSRMNQGEQSSAWPALRDDDSWTLQEAMKTPIFWIYIFSRMLPSAVVTGLVFHQVSLFTSLGHGPRVAAETYGMMAVLGALASLSSGYIVDWFRPGWVLAVQLISMAFGMIIAMIMTDPWQLFVYAAAIAFVNGGGAVFDGAVWPNLFGRRYQGSIRGFATTMMVAGSAAGPIMFGLSYDNSGGYALVLWIAIAVALLAAFLSLLAPMPRRQKDGDRQMTEAPPAG